ncbi:MAG TPA: nuclear transport factor 2 family protein [Pyrinomonadaceae bacterium]|nr:nuclear transport factor 2 family protein [Pyrinomonadaceae bacterium]
MKNILLLAGFALLISYSTPLVAQSQSDRSQTSPDEGKTKTKDGRTIARDKSKPVRKAIEDWYARNMAAFKAKDLAAIMALRADDFHTVTPDGTVNTRAYMETRTRLFLERIDHFISQDNQIGTIEVEGDLASADISQKTVRMQRFPDGTLHKVESAVVQRETWKKTVEGWKLYRVDNIRDGDLLLDDKPYKPNQ